MNKEEIQQIFNSGGKLTGKDLDDLLLESVIIKGIAYKNQLHRRMIYDSEFIKGVNYGEIRSGHPEGQVIFHILDVLKNVDKYSEASNKENLKEIALIHDTFKYKVDMALPRIGENHHGMFARKFGEKYSLSKPVLDIIELHDEAYNSWLKGFSGKNWKKAEERAYKLIERIGNNLDLYLVFYKCDSEVIGKNLDNYNWFKELAQK